MSIKGGSWSVPSRMPLPAQHFFEISYPRAIGALADGDKLVIGNNPILGHLQKHMLHVRKFLSLSAITLPLLYSFLWWKRSGASKLTKAGAVWLVHSVANVFRFNGAAARGPGHRGVQPQHAHNWSRLSIVIGQHLQVLQFENWS